MMSKFGIVEEKVPGAKREKKVEDYKKSRTEHSNPLMVTEWLRDEIMFKEFETFKIQNGMLTDIYLFS